MHCAVLALIHAASSAVAHDIPESYPNLFDAPHDQRRPSVYQLQLPPRSQERLNQSRGTLPCVCARRGGPRWARLLREGWPGLGRRQRLRRYGRRAGGGVESLAVGLAGVI